MARSILLLALLLASTPHRATAQTYDGRWNAGPTRVQVSISSWGPDCGPRPRSSTSPAAGRVRISQSGDHLLIHGRRNLRTDRCWSENRAVRRVSTSHRGGTWRTTCRTPESDPRSERGTYALRAAGEDRLELTDTSRYDWQLNESRCVGTVTSTQTFTRVGRSEPTPPETTPPERSCTPGSAATLRLRPREARIEPGGRVRLRAVALDADGCALRRPRVQWSLHGLPGREGSLNRGLFEAGADSQTSEGEFRITARLGNLRAEATVSVRTADLSDLIAKRAAFGVVQAGEEDAEAGFSAGVSASNTSGGGRSWIGLAVGLLGAAVTALGLLGIALALLRRRRLAAASAADPQIRTAYGSLPPPPKSVPPQAPKPKSVPPEPPTLICPVCRRGFAAGTAACSTDQAGLVPYSEFVAQHRAQETAAARICPKCGGRYGAQVTFCGKDGTELVETS